MVALDSGGGVVASLHSTPPPPPQLSLSPKATTTSSSSSTVDHHHHHHHHGDDNSSDGNDSGVVVGTKQMDRGALGFNGDVATELSNVQKVLSGATAGAFCRLITNPFDLVKIRLQVQAEPIALNVAGKLNPSKYTGLFQTFRSIYTEEGLRGFYKGHLNGQILSISNGITQYGLFELSSQSLYLLGITNAHHNSFIAGYFSALSSVFICYPVDLLRTRFSSQPSYYYTSMSNALRKIYATEGVRGFYKGVCPAMFSQAPQASIFFGAYSVFKEVYDSAAQYVFKTDSNLSEIDMMRTTVCSSSAGFFSKILIYPMDLIKKRMQIQGFAEGRSDLGKTYNYSNSLQCVKQIVKYEGARGLYKGLLPGLLKATVVSSSSLIAYEFTKNMLLCFNKNE